MSIEPDHGQFAHLVKIRQQIFHDLVKAKRLIDRGWCQHASSRLTAQWGGFIIKNQYCATGAVAKACEDDIDRAIISIRALFGAIAPQYEPGDFESCVGTIQAWNDAAGRTKTEILAGFDGALANIRAP